VLDLKWVRKNPGAVKADLKKRGDAQKQVWFEELLEKDEENRKLGMQLDELRARRNAVTNEIRLAVKGGNSQKADALKKEAGELPEKIKAGEARETELQERIRFLLMRLPNVLHESVPVGKDDSGNVEVKRWGKPRDFGFELKTHGELAASLGVADFERAAKVSGAGFAFVKGELALLEMALQRLAVEHLVKKGFTLVEPPLMMRRKPYEGVTDLADFESVMYKIDGEESYLIATSEHPMGAMYQDEVIDEKDLPIKLAGLSACFRREIGAHGVDTKGLFRMHQFNKIEQFVFCMPEDSWKWHEQLLQNAEELWQALELPYRVISICTGDIGIVAAKKYDIEAWMPREKAFKEVVSCSNCTAYQAVRLNVRYRKGKQASQDEEKGFVHTLNSTAIATSRALRAILENYQTEKGTVEVPSVLKPFMMGIEEIGRK
jgi:seryl-tRNA synthetase